MKIKNIILHISNLTVVLFVIIFSCNIYSQPIGILSGDTRKSKITDQVIQIYDVEVSSFLIEKNKPDSFYNQYKICDGKYSTAWCEGVKSEGIGEWIKEIFHPDYVKKGIYSIWRVSIINGYVASKKLYYENNRVKKISIEFSEGDKVIIDLKDGVLDYQQFEFTNKKIWAKWAKVTILEIYKGSKYNDTCISELKFEDTRSTTEMWSK